MLSSAVWVIFIVVVDFVLPLYDPIGVNTSTCLSVVSVTILAKLDKVVAMKISGRIFWSVALHRSSW